MWLTKPYASALPSCLPLHLCAYIEPGKDMSVAESIEAGVLKPGSIYARFAELTPFKSPLEEQQAQWKVGGACLLNLVAGTDLGCISWWHDAVVIVFCGGLQLPLPWSASPDLPLTCCPPLLQGTGFYD